MKNRFMTFIGIGLLAVQSVYPSTSIADTLPNHEDGVSIVKTATGFKNNVIAKLANMSIGGQEQQNKQSIQKGVDSNESAVLETASSMQSFIINNNTVLSDLLGKIKEAREVQIEVKTNTRQAIFDNILTENKINLNAFPQAHDLVEDMNWASKIMQDNFDFQNDALAFSILGVESSFGDTKVNGNVDHWSKIRGKNVGGEQAIGPFQVMPSYINLVMNEKNKYTKQIRKIIKERFPEIVDAKSPADFVADHPKLQVLFGYIGMYDLMGQQQVAHPPKGMSKLEAMFRTYNAGPDTNTWGGPENNSHATRGMEYYSALKDIDKKLDKITVAYEDAIQKTFESNIENKQMIQVAMGDIQNKVGSIKDKYLTEDDKYSTGMALR